jgi:hypothetical protein
VRHRLAANLKPIGNLQFRVGTNGREVDDLVEALLQAGRLNVLKKAKAPSKLTPSVVRAKLNCPGQTVGFIKRKAPRERLDAASAGAGRMWLKPARAEEDVHSFAAEGFHALPKWDPVSERRVDEWQDDDRRVQSGHLGEDAQGVGIADALCPFVDRVVCGRSNDDGIGYYRSRRAWLAVLAADGIASQFLDGFLVEEVQSGGSRDELDRPVSVNSQLYQGAYLRRGTCAADDDC